MRDGLRNVWFRPFVNSESLCGFPLSERFSWEPKLWFENSCDEFSGRRGSHLVIPVASDPTMDSARGRALESNERS